MIEQLTLFSPRPRIRAARVFGRVTLRDHAILQPRLTSIKDRIREWFQTHPQAHVKAHEVAEALGLRVENCVAPRLSELASEGFLDLTTERAEGRFRVSNRRYRMREAA